MKPHNPELISALVDGELTGLRRWLVQRHVGQCAVCAAEYRHLEHVRQMLAENPVQPQMPETAEFFWSKVKRDIQAQAGQTESIPLPQLSLTDWLSQRRYAVIAIVSSSAVVAAMLLAVTLIRPTGQQVFVSRVATTLPNTTATTIAEQDSDTPVIWVTGLPWTKDMTEMKTVFANLDT